MLASGAPICHLEEAAPGLRPDQAATGLMARSGPSYSSGSSRFNFGKVRAGCEVVRTWASNNVPQAPAVALFDKHGVIDTLSDIETQKLEIAMDHTNMPYGLCSYAPRDRARHTCRGSFSRSPFMDRCDFLIFTDELVNPDQDERVDVYRDHLLPEKAIRISGDKGDAARLLGVPVVVFDDRGDQLEIILQKASYRSEALLVERREQKRRRHQYWRDCKCMSDRPDGQLGWAAISRRFFHERRSAAVPRDEYLVQTILRRTVNTPRCWCTRYGKCIRRSMTLRHWQV